MVRKLQSVLFVALAFVICTPEILAQAPPAPRPPKQVIRGTTWTSEEITLSEQARLKPGSMFHFGITLPAGATLGGDPAEGITIQTSLSIDEEIMLPAGTKLPKWTRLASGSVVPHDVPLTKEYAVGGVRVFGSASNTLLTREAAKTQRRLQELEDRDVGGIDEATVDKKIAASEARVTKYVDGRIVEVNARITREVSSLKDLIKETASNLKPSQSTSVTVQHEQVIVFGCCPSFPRGGYKVCRGGTWYYYSY